MIALLFPGQGSEKLNFEHNKTEKHFLDLTKKFIGIDLQKINFEKKNTQIVQLETFISSITKFHNFLSENKNPIFCTAGLSFGEISTLYVSEILNFENCLELIMKRGEFLDECCKKYESGMIAVLGLKDNLIKKICLEEKIWPANYNYDGQLVVSGKIKNLKNSKEKFIKLGAKVIELNVNGAFHCPLMQEAKINFSNYLEQKIFQEPKCEIYQNVNALPSIKSEIIKKNIIEQLTNPVLWKQSILNMKKNKIENFIDFSEKEILKKFLNRI